MRWWWLAVILGLPLLGLGILLGVPDLDIRWEHHPSHFWLVLGTALVNVALAYVTNEAANRHADARLSLISLAFLLAAGFLGLHALATPGTLLPDPNAGFVLATPVGLAAASILAAASVSPLAGPRSGVILRHRVALRRGVVGLMLAWAAVSLLRLPPLNGPLPPEEAGGPLAILAVAAIGLYALSAWRYAEVFRRKRSDVALALVAALVLLAEAMVAVALSRNWQLSWWEWHLLMTVAFVLIAVAVRAEYQRTGSLSTTFQPIYLEATLARLNRWHARAIADLASAQERGEPIERLLADLRRDGASADETSILAEAAREMRRVDELFRPYLPQDLAGRLRREPELAELGGVERTVSALFADLAGFTTFSESHPPTEVLAMLNEFWAAVVPVIDAEAGSIEHFAGDGVLVMFNAVGDQPDHAARAARCAMEIIRRTDPIAGSNRGWPRFRIGLNTGPAVVGNVGTEGRRSFATIGDTTNLAARLLQAAQPGQAVVSAATHEALQEAGFELAPLGAFAVKGKQQPQEAWALVRG